VSYTGGELQPRPQHVPVPYHGQHGGGQVASAVSWSPRTWISGRGVVVVGVGLIVLSLVWKWIFLSHYYFWQDDFNFTELALSSPLSLHYLTNIAAGHMFPGLYLLYWVWARVALYNWASASVISLVMLAAAGFAGLRVLRTLFGNRPAILVPLVLYLASPLTMPDIRTWYAAIETLPLQVACFMALNAHVYYVRTGRFRHAVVAAFWLVAGLLFYEKSVFVPVLLFLITSAFLMEGPWLRTAWRCLVRYWPSWLLQVVILGIYAALFESGLKTSSVRPGLPSTPGASFTFSWDLLKDSLLPGAFGGPWQWFPQPSSTGPEYAYALPPQALIWLSVIAAASVIAVSIWARRYAWRAWAIAAVWFLGADIAPIVLGRIADITTPGVAGLLALETRYVSDLPPVLAICVGLAFLPIDGLPDVRQNRRMATIEGLAVQPWRIAAAGLVGVFLVGSVFSVQSFVSDTTSAPDKTFMADAEASVAQAPTGTVIVDQLVPDSLMIGLFTMSALDSHVIGPTETAADKARVRWTTAPRGTIDRLMVLGNNGLLQQVSIYGPHSVPLPAGQSCYTSSSGQLVIPFLSNTFAGADELRIGYLASKAENGKSITVNWGGVSQRVALQAGLHYAYLPERGSVGSVTFPDAPSVKGGLCVGGMDAGIIV
jgi:hypothetical protein